MKGATGRYEDPKVNLQCSIKVTNEGMLDVDLNMQERKAAKEAFELAASARFLSHYTEYVESTKE